MGVYVDMRMPDGCLDCPMFNGVGCKATMRMFPNWQNVAARPGDCPISDQSPERKNGHWEIETIGTGTYIVCSACGSAYRAAEWGKTCKNCKADMGDGEIPEILRCLVGEHE